MAIHSFACKETKLIWEGNISRKLPRDIQDRALRKLRQLDAALTVDDLKNPPSNHLESLRGDRKEQMSIRINNQWRLCFIWENNKAFEVEIVDYH
jgi:proteic killer suppression protein